MGKILCWVGFHGWKPMLKAFHGATRAGVYAIEVLGYVPKGVWPQVLAHQAEMKRKKKHEPMTVMVGRKCRRCGRVER